VIFSPHQKRGGEIVLSMEGKQKGQTRSIIAIGWRTGEFQKSSANIKSEKVCRNKKEMRLGGESITWWELNLAQSGVDPALEAVGEYKSI